MATTSLPVDRLTATDCNAAARAKSKVSEQDFIQLQETLEETKIKAKSLTSEKNEELNQLSTNKIKLEKKYNEIELLNLQVA